MSDYGYELMEATLDATYKALSKIPEPHADPTRPPFEDWQECLSCGAETTNALCKECEEEAKLERALEERNL